MDHIFCHSGLEIMDERNVYLPTAIDTEKYCPMEKDWNDKIIFGHTPSRQHIKYSEIFFEASEKLKDKYKDQIEIVLIEGMPYKECMKQRRNFHIFFDQVNQRPQPKGAYRHYGTALVESACFETVCLIGNDRPEEPLVNVWTADEIIHSVSEMMDDRYMMKRRAIETRQCVIDKHGYEAVSKRFMSHILENHKLRKNIYQRHMDRIRTPRLMKEMVSG